MGRLAWIMPLLALGIAACGSTSDAERFSLTTPGTDDMVVREIAGSAAKPPEKPTRGEVRVIRGWADALRTGHVNQAAGFFRVGALVLDGTNPLRELPDRGAVREFNRGLPCGAKLVETERGQGLFVIATFRLTERTGPGAKPCAGGRNVAVAVLVQKRRIVRWLRQPDPVVQPADPDTS